MKTHTVHTYTVLELRELFPDAFARAYERRNRHLQEIPWQDETIESLLALVKSAGLKVRDYSLGAYNQGNCLRLVGFDGENLAGARAFAWLENNLFGPLRISYTARDRWKRAKYGRDYRAGCVPPCPLTGYCADEDYLAALRNNLRKGYTVRKAFERLADVCAEILENEYEAACSIDAFIDEAEANGYEFTEDGERFS